MHEEFITRTSCSTERTQDKNDFIYLYNRRSILEVMYMKQFLRIQSSDTSNGETLYLINR